MAMACLRLVTFLPELPLRNVPFLRFFIARSTFFAEALESARAIACLPIFVSMHKRRQIKQFLDVLRRSLGIAGSRSHCAI